MEILLVVGVIALIAGVVIYRKKSKTRTPKGNIPWTPPADPNKQID